MIRILREHFDYVVIDTPPGFDDQVLGAFDETDECVLVATLDVPTVKNVKVAIETLDPLNLVQGNRHLVLNRADDEVGLAQATSRTSWMKVAIALPSSPAVASATNHGQPDRAVQAGPPVSQGAHRARPCRLAGDRADREPRRAGQARRVRRRK